MKKFFTKLFFLFFSSFIFAQSFLQNDVSLYQELFAAYNSGFYPGVVQYAQTLLTSYPESAYVGSAMILEGESFAKMKMFENAREVLLKSQKIDASVSLKNQAVFWLGETFFALEDYNSALSCYYLYCNSAGEDAKLYANAILGAARIYYKKNEFEKAIPLFEYAVQNGAKYAQEDFFESLVKLSDSYNKANLPQKNLKLYENIKEENVGGLNYCLLTEYAGDSYFELKKYKAAYEKYISVLESGYTEFAAAALKKAYNVSSLYKNQVGTEPGAVLQKVQQSFSKNPELLCEFWIRLGTDAFYEGDYEKASKYFDEADSLSIPELYEFSAMYRAMILAGNQITEKTALDAYNFLLKASEEQKKLENPRYKNEYYKLLAKYSACASLWKESYDFASFVNPQDDVSRYYKALADYNLGNFLDSASALKNTTTSQTELYALSLAKMQNLRDSAFVFGDMEESFGLSDEQRLNYAKVLLLSGRYKESQIQSAKCSLNEANYILGLAQFNTKSWPYAEKSFSSFINSADKKDKNLQKSLSYASFYKGYSQYRQGKTKESYAELENFLKKWPNHELAWAARMAAANSAVQNGNYKNALEMSKQAVKTSINSTSLEEAVLLQSNILCDMQEFGNALDLLSPYADLGSSFGMNVLFQTGRIYETLGNIEQADFYFKKVSDLFLREKTGEDAMFRRGELFYSKENYSTALVRFGEYISRYPNGNFVDAAMYFSADCLAKDGNVKRAILQNRALVQKFPESTYIYASVKNLMNLNRTIGNYREASENAQYLLSKYKEQAKNDGVEETLATLKQLTSGKNEEIVLKENEYNKNGAEKSALGRKIGTELSALYAKSSETLSEAVKLSEKLLAIQQKNLEGESLYAAQNAKLLGELYRVAGKNVDSAKKFLLAAEYFRMNLGNDENAAYSMYSAYDAFVAANLLADAQQTAESLKKLYPSSQYSKSIKNVSTGEKL